MNLNTEARRLFEEMRAAQATDERLGRDLAAELTPAQAERLTALSDAGVAAATLRADWIIAELARHLPMVATAILEMFAHIEAEAFERQGACCDHIRAPGSAC